MKFSVLMSVYHMDKPGYLKEALDSIINQTLSPNEIVIVKDGPLNKSLDEVLNKYFLNNKELINIVSLEKNSGLGMALNYGITHCKYDIVARMDSDDVCEKERFKKQIEVMKSGKFDIIGSNIVEYDETMQEMLSERIVPMSNEDIKKKIKFKNPLNHMTIMYKKDIIIKANNYEHCPYFEDYYLWCKTLKNGARFYNIKESLIKVRAGKEFSTRRGGIKYIKHMYNFEKKILTLKVINRIEFLMNICIRSIVAIFPNNLRYIFYNKVLRKKKNNG